MAMNKQKTGNKIQYKLIIFDFDGTLADVRKYAVPIFNRLADKYHFKKINSVDDIRKLSLSQLWKTYHIPVFKLPRILKEAQKIQLENMNQIGDYNLTPIIKKLSKHFKLVILSSNSKKVIKVFLEKHDTLNCFNRVIGYPKLFGKSVVLAQLLMEYRLKPSQVLYVGDEVRDIEAAKKVHIDIAAVTWGLNDENLLRKYNPKYIINNSKELLNLF